MHTETEVLSKARAILAAHAAPLGPSKADTISALDALLGQPTIESIAFAQDRLNSERYRLLRDVPNDFLGVAGHPCIAVPTGPTTGCYFNGTDADRAVDVAMLRAVIALASTGVTIEQVSQ